MDTWKQKKKRRHRQSAVQSVQCTDSSDKQYQCLLSYLIACCVGWKKKKEVNAVGSVSPSGWGWYPLEMCLGQRYAHSLSLPLSLPLSLSLSCWVGISYDCPEVSAQGQREGEITCKRMNCTEPVRCRKLPPGCPLLFLFSVTSYVSSLTSPISLPHHLLYFLFAPLAATALATGHCLRMSGNWAAKQQCIWETGVKTKLFMPCYAFKM